MKTTVLILSATIGCMCACSDDRTTDSSGLSDAIRFESAIRTKAGPVTGMQFAAGSEVGVYTLEKEDASGILIMNNQACTVSESGGLTYEPLQFYKKAALYSFWACYPYDVSTTVPAPGEAPRLACTFATTPSAQIDYMYATPVEDRRPDAGVCQLDFNHALTQITVKVVNGTDAPLTLHSLKVKAPGGATLNMGNGTWSSVAGTKSYTLYNPATSQIIASKKSYSVPGQLMLLPVAAGGEEYTFDLSVTEGKNTEATHKTGQTLTLPEGGLKAGYSYNYTLTYKAASILLSASVVEWQYTDGPGITIK